MGNAPEAPTVQLLSHRHVLSIPAFFENSTGRTRDITPAHKQSTISLQRHIFMGLPIKIGLPGSKVLKVVKQLYSFSESAFHCYLYLY